MTITFHVYITGKSYRIVLVVCVQEVIGTPQPVYVTAVRLICVRFMYSNLSPAWCRCESIIKPKPYKCIILGVIGVLSVLSYETSISVPGVTYTTQDVKDVCNFPRVRIQRVTVTTPPHILNYYTDDKYTRSFSGTCSSTTG
jgi:hypothetical protein